jgi:hypothetical protein
VNPYAILGAVLVGAAALGGSYWQGRQDGAAAVVASHADAEKIRQETIRAADEGTARALAKLEVKHVTIRQAVQREVIEKPVFRDCRSGPDAVRLLNVAAGHDGAASAPGAGELPAASRPE